MTLTTDRVVIIGAGLAALSAALRLAPHPVLVVSPDPLGDGASSAWAQGGVAAAIGPNDQAADHAADTIRAGAGIVDPDIARLVTALARDHIADLTQLGAPFDRDPSGGYVLSHEAAHGRPRVVRVMGDQAGRAIMAALVAAVRKTPSIQVAEGVMTTSLFCEGGRVSGVRLERADRPSGQRALRAPAVLLAGGGAAGLYAVTTNPPRIRGQAMGLAARAGALIADPEFIQFHPTAIASGEDPAPLATEALRGEGAVLINDRGARFMPDLHPDAELAPRDVVARAIFAQTQAGRQPALDTRACLGPLILTRFPAVSAACLRMGIDPATQPIPVAAAAHYHMGGVATDRRGRSSLPGLWVCGEAASTGLHGANRLASNGLLEALVFARLAADDIAAGLGRAAPCRPLTLDFDEGGQAVDAALVARLRRVMTAQVGVVRDADGLTQALDHIADMEEKASASEQMLNMLAAARLIATAALWRKESRGGHFRADCPASHPAQAHRTKLTLAAAMTGTNPKEPAPYAARHLA